MSRIRCIGAKASRDFLDRRELAGKRSPLAGSKRGDQSCGRGPYMTVRVVPALSHDFKKLVPGKLISISVRVIQGAVPDKIVAESALPQGFLSIAFPLEKAVPTQRGSAIRGSLLEPGGVADAIDCATSASAADRDE